MKEQSGVLAINPRTFPVRMVLWDEYEESKARNLYLHANELTFLVSALG